MSATTGPVQQRTTPQAHALGGSQHTADTLANLNALVTGGSLDFDSASRPPTSHALGTAHSTDTLANLNAKVSDATLVHTAYTLGTDLTGTIATPEVAKIRGYAVQDHAPLDGEVLQWVNANSQYEPTAAGAPGAHLLGGTSHTADSLGNLNAKVTGGSLDFATAQRTAVIHNLGSNLRHGVDTLANLNALISDANLDDSGDSRTPLTHGLGSHSTCILADLNSMVSDATLDTNTASRTPTQHGLGSSTYHSTTTLANLNGRISDATLEGTESLAHIYLYRTATFDMPANDTWYDLPWNIAATVKVNVTHSHTSNPEQITLTKGGKYLINFDLIFHKAASASTLSVHLLDDSTEIPGSFRQSRSGAWFNQISGSVLCSIAVDSVIELQVGTSVAGTDVFYYDAAGYPEATTFVSAATAIMRIGP